MTVFVAISCMMIGYTAGLVAAEIRVDTFWGGFTVSGIAIVAALALSGGLLFVTNAT